MGIDFFLRTSLVVSILATLPVKANAWLQSSDAAVGTEPSAKNCIAGCETPDDRPGSSSGKKAKEQDHASADNGMTLKKVFVNLPGDQKAIWTSPFRLRPNDAIWLAPLAGATGVLIGSDQHSMARARSNPDAISLSNNVANAGVAGLVAVPAFMYVLSSWNGDSRQHETGLLSGEALVNSLAVSEALKVVFARERPTATGGQGKFFTDVGNGSMPSMHSMLGWTAASVIAHEYPGPLTQVLAYGAAAAVSVSRVTGRQHFPSDVVVGGALGWMIGHQVYKAHHNSDLDTPYFGSFTRDPKEVDASKLGSPSVPLDSWVYPALERLAALGYIKTQFTGLRPWTRRECMRQIEEAEYFAQDLPPNSGVAQTIEQLKAEFKNDGKQYQTVSVDSIYTRYANINGTPLRDSYHFGQTIWNDNGRPYEQGNNLFAGASLHAVSGPFFFYVQGEFQHVPGRPALTAAQQNLVNTVDCNVTAPQCPPNSPQGPPPSPVSAINRSYPLDMYAGLQMGAYAATFGKQSLWLGPGETGPLMLGNNADPMYMFRFSRTTPLLLPGFLRHVGEIRGEFFFAKLSGHQFPARPFFNLQKLSIHPTKNLEIGFTRSSLWGGVGRPFTVHALERNFLALGDTPPGNPIGNFAERNDIGDRKSGFDFSYRVPGLRNWLTVYSDMYSDDDPSPLANPRRAAVNPGLYLSHLPRFAKLDLRGEMVSTQALTATDRGGQFLYWNFRYHDSNTNKGILFGNQTGRDGRTYQVSSTYHFSAMTSLQLIYRDTKASALFVPGGGTQSDGAARVRWQVRPNWSVDTLLQYERWLIPVLHPTAQHDFTTSLQLTYTPHVNNILQPPGK
jgi:membrane-associated phospholipid phosphatase